MNSLPDPKDPPNRLWRGLLLDKSGDTWDEIGWTLCWNSRSQAKEAGYYYAMANHLEMFTISTYPFEGQRKQVGTMTSQGDTFGIYLGYQNDETPLDHSANCLQYADFITASFEVTEDND